VPPGSQQVIILGTKCLLMTNLIRIEKGFAIQSAEIRRRHAHLRPSRLTVSYVGLDSGREVAFVALDWWPEFVALYELYVPVGLRNVGVGTAVLKEVERFAVQEGCSALHLLPSPLDESTSRDSLTRWYSKRGYKAHPKAPEEMIKSF
jgi:hypothetical protein